MRTESYEIIIPEKARVMTEDEMEYEGGWLNFIASACCAVAGVVADYAGDQGWISKSDAVRQEASDWNAGHS